MSVPNLIDVVRGVYAQGGHDLTTHEGAGRFTEAAVLALNRSNRRFGHLRKNPGQTQYNGHAVDAALWLSDTPGQSVAVDFIVGGGAPGASIGWQLDQPRYSASDWYAPTDTVRPHHTALGCSLFWLLAGSTRYESQLKNNLDWISTELKADFVRAFVVLGGDFFSGVDPWADLATDWRSPGFAAEMNYAIDLCRAYNLKIAWTLVGGRAQVNTVPDQLALVDKVGAVLANRADTVQYVEMWNEYLVNKGNRLELRNMAKVMEPYLPNTPIALSSPNCVMGGRATAAEVIAEVRSLYEGSVANLITVHPTRPEPIWNAETIGALNDFNTFYEFAIGEPRGPGASAGGDVDNPALLASDYQSAIRGGAIAYVYHTKPGVWGGHCHGFPDQNLHANIYDTRNADAIASALASLRHTGGIPTIPGGTVNAYPPEMNNDGTAYWQLFKAEVVKRYAQANAPLDDFYPVWFARTAYDIAAGLDAEASKTKHLKELDQALGLA